MIRFQDGSSAERRGRDASKGEICKTDRELLFAFNSVLPLQVFFGCSAELGLVGCLLCNCTSAQLNDVNKISVLLPA